MTSRTLASLLALFAAAGCVVEGDDVYERPETEAAGGSGPVGGGAGEGPSWAEIGPILAEKCGPCHGEPLENGAPFSFLDYETAAEKADRAVERTEAGTMPPEGWPRLTDAELDLLRAWAEAGAPRGEAAPPRWADVEPIMIGKCGACHGPTPANGAPYPLTDYENAAAHAERSAIRVEAQTMPPPGLGFEMCTPEETRLLRAWADAGAVR